jgi:hypothetical protein
MTRIERPQYALTIADYGTHVAWVLATGGGPVDSGRVSLNDFNLDSAWSTAWVEANKARRALEDGGS